MTRKTRAAILLFITPFLFPVAFALAQGATAPAMFTPFKKGGATTLTAATTATSGCTDGAFLYSLSSLLNCGAVLTTDGNTVTINNGAAAASIFVAKDNGTAVVTIADGGSTTFASGAVISSNQNLSLGGLGYIYGVTGLTPDSPTLATATNSESWHLMQLADVGSDFQNACTTGLGTAACTDPTFIIQSHNVDTGEFLSLAHDGKAGVIVGGNSTVLDGTIRLGGTVTLTESSATSVLTVPVAVSTGTGGEIMYTVEAKDATNTQVRRGSVRYAVANNSSGTETCGVYGVDNAATVNPAETNDGSGAGAITSGTLTYAWTSDTTGTNQCVLKLNGVSSLTQTTFQIHYTVIQSGPGVPTGGD